jgi:hypothetical protein
MTNDSVLKPRSSPDTSSAARERRRPGRVAYENNELIELLRDVGSATDALPVTAFRDTEDAPDDDPLRAAKGVATGVLVSLGCWTGIGLAVWLFRGS